LFRGFALSTVSDTTNDHFRILGDRDFIPF